jgi:hypothetical protein
MNRVLFALLFFLIGIAFIGALSIAPVLDCNELCPDWFTGYLIAYYALPLVWLFCGAMAGSRSARLRAGATLMVLNAFALAGVIAGTRNFVML